MKVSPEEPFEVVYSLFKHQYMDYLFEPFAVQLNAKGRLTYTHQTISPKNAEEFNSRLDEDDYNLITLMEEIHQESISNYFWKKRTKPEFFFLTTFHQNTGDKMLQQEIYQYVERRRAQILELIGGKKLFKMGKDGEPAWNPIEVSAEKASVLFHFRKNKDNTHYFPTIKLNGKKVIFYRNDSYLVCKEPAWIVANDVLFSFEKKLNGAKLLPFLSKKFILIQKEMEDTYYKKFVAPLVAECDVYAKGFEIKTEKPIPTPKLTLSEISMAKTPTLFNNAEEEATVDPEKVLIELSFRYGLHDFQATQLKEVSVSVIQKNGSYTFLRINRDMQREKSIIQKLEKSGLPLKNSRITLPKSKAFDWINHQRTLLREFDLHQTKNGKRYSLEESIMDLEVSEGIDWFDLKATIKFGTQEVSFLVVREHILNGKTEIKLPNGEVGVIPESWIIRYKDLFAFTTQKDGKITLSKMHLSLVQELKEGKHAKVTITRKLERLFEFEEIKEYPMPRSFKGKLRPYQLAGYNWLRFLEDYNFGGCLADDMGLGKTIQALSLLQHEKNVNPIATNLLIMPTSLLYNWEMEARKFTPELKLLNYTGIGRYKCSHQFAKYDLVLTSYGTTRIDAEVLSGFYFNYIILDESQVIKNPGSLISKKVGMLKSRRKLILSGTPIENSTLDLWSQMNFINPGLLGNETYFKKTYLIPIEKKKDEHKTRKLNNLIKPFILRREKAIVAKDLPEKIISIHYCSMTENQKKLYEESKNVFKNQIINVIESNGLAKSHIILLQGLTHLRQIANHPKMINPEYKGDSGKLEAVTQMIENIIPKGHKVLIFSQFVKHLMIISEYMKGQRIRFAYLDGGTKNRRQQVDRFQNEKDVSAFLVSLKAGGTGLNLTKADYVFLLDPWWNPAVETQAIDRTHRIGQEHTVFAYKYITKDTIEEKILQLQKHKQKLASELITVEDSFVKSLSKADIQQLFD